MSTPPLSDELAAEAAAAYQAFMCKIKPAAESLGLHPNTFTGRLKEAAIRGMLGTKPVLPGFAISKTTAVIDADGETVREFIQQRPERGPEFKVPKGHSIKGVSALVDRDNKTIQTWIKTRDEPDPVDSAKKVARAIARYHYEPVVVPEPETCLSDKITIYPIADWHMGLLAWGKETGKAWDVEIARRELMGGTARLMNATPNSGTAVLLVLGDMFHSDGYRPETPKSKNALDVDGRYPKVVNVTGEMMIDAIALALAKHERVIVRILRGNHDPISAFWLAFALKQKFAGHSRIEVDDSPSPFWWFRFGKCFFGGNHGDEAKPSSLPMVMAVDRPDDWAASTLRRIYTGHEHKEREILVGEQPGGVIVFTMRAPIARDAWTDSGGYRSGRSLVSETFDAAGQGPDRVTINL